jgi:hypothetical protein
MKEEEEKEKNSLKGSKLSLYFIFTIIQLLEIF